MTLDFETVFEKALFADFWVILVNHPARFSYEQLKEMDSRYADFKAFKSKKIIYTNASNSLYFEKGLLEPHIVLADLVVMFQVMDVMA